MISFAERLNKMRDEGWKFMLFSSVKSDGTWSFSARHFSSYAWITYEHPDPEVLIQAFLDDHAPAPQQGELF